MVTHRGMSEAALRRTLRRLLRDLDLRRPLQPESLRARLEVWRERPIEVVGWPIPAGELSGLLLELPTRDLVVYQSETTRAHQDHIVFHELVHLIRGHGAGKACGQSARDGATIAPDEREAEIGAAILSSWSDPVVSPVVADDVPGRWFSALSGAGAWT